MSLQDKINCLSEYDTLVLEFDEYFEKIEIKKPVTIDGGGGTICFTSGPVVSIDSKDVKLRNINLEVTSRVDKNDKESALALKVKENIRVKLDKVIVKGDVTGVVSENGAWRYPDVLRIWPVKPHETNYFVFEMDVPVSCALETEIEDLRIVNPALAPGLNQVLIEVSNLKKDTILFGQIGIQSTYLKRMISVCGGAFGSPTDMAAPDKSNPVVLNTLPATSQKQSMADKRPTNHRHGKLFDYIRQFPKPRQAAKDHDGRNAPKTPAGAKKNAKISQRDRDESTMLKITHSDWRKYKGLLKIVAACIVVAVLAGLGIYFFFRQAEPEAGRDSTPTTTIATPTSIPTITPQPTITATPTQPPSIDRIKPQGELKGVKTTYGIGDRVQFRIQGTDNKALKGMGFEVQQTTIQKKWNSSDRSDQKDWFFRTNGMQPGRYHYTYYFEDTAGNKLQKSGHFDLELARKYGYIDIVTEPPGVGIYIEGQKFGVTPKHNFKYGAGKVKISFVDHYHGINETTIVDIQPDRHSIEKMVFPVKYGYLNINTTPKTTMTIFGKEIGKTPRARLKLPSGKKTIRFINKRFNIDITKEITIIADQTVKHSFNFLH